MPTEEIINDVPSTVTFLNMIAKELGIPLMNDYRGVEWELVGAIIQDIHLRMDKGRRLRNRMEHLKKEFQEYNRFSLVDLIKSHEKG